MIASAAWHCLAWGLSALQKLCGALGPQRALAGVPGRRSRNAASPGQPNSGTFILRTAITAGLDGGPGGDPGSQAFGCGATPQPGLTRGDRHPSNARPQELTACSQHLSVLLAMLHAALAGEQVCRPCVSGAHVCTQGLGKEMHMRRLNASERGTTNARHPQCTGVQRACKKRIPRARRPTEKTPPAPPETECGAESKAVHLAWKTQNWAALGCEHKQCS